MPAAPQRVEGQSFDVDAAMNQALKELGLDHDASNLPTAEAAPGMETSEETSDLETPPEQSQTQQQKPKEEKPPTQDRLSRGFAKLHRQQEAFEAEKQSFATERQSFQTERQAFQTERDTWTQQREAWKKNPLAAIEDLGWNLDRFVKFVLEDGKVPPEVVAKQLADEQKNELKKTQEELEAIKRDKLAAEDTRLSRMFEEKTEARVKELLGDEGSYLEDALAKFPMVAKVDDLVGRTDVLFDVRKLLVQHLQQTGQAVDPIQALSYLDKAYRKRFPKLATDLGRNPAQSRAVQSAESGAQAKPVQLTSREVSDIGTPSDEELSSMTREQREERALQLFRGR